MDFEHCKDPLASPFGLRWSKSGESLLQLGTANRMMKTGQNSTLVCVSLKALSTSRTTVDEMINCVSLYSILAYRDTLKNGTLSRCITLNRCISAPGVFSINVCVHAHIMHRNEQRTTTLRFLSLPVWWTDWLMPYLSGMATGMTAGCLRGDDWLADW